MLQTKLDEQDLNVLRVIEDKIWLGQFLRETSYGEIDKALWPSIGWNYRDYQKQFLTDESQFILYTGGRAIGKCEPGNNKIYTTEGYQRVSKLAKLPYFTVYALSDSMTLEQRRAKAEYDKEAACYQIQTESGHVFTGTKQHPVLTPQGYKIMELLTTDDYVAVATQLPHDSTTETFEWYELRLLGYIFLNKKFFSTTPIIPRFKKIGAEIEVIAEEMVCNWRKHFDGAYTLERRLGPFKHPLKTLLSDLKLAHRYHWGTVYKVPDVILKESKRNIKYFLEGVFAQFATLSRNEVTLQLHTKIMCQQFQEMLLYYGIESRYDDKHVLTLLDYRAVYRFWNTFTLPGISVGELPLPEHTHDATEFMRFDRVINKFQSHTLTDVYAVYVYKDNNYISGNVYVHNTVVQEDKMLYNIVNSDLEFPDTPQMLFITPNQAQLTPVQNGLISKITGSPLLKGFLNAINKSVGIMNFKKPAREFILHMRIAGTKAESNVIGLHLPKVLADESQLLSQEFFTFMQPAINTWERKTQQTYTGVSNGLRTSVLYMLDQKSPKYKKYRIPAPNNPFYSYEQYKDDLIRHGGEQSDDFQRTVLGKHGSAAMQLIPRDTIHTETYSFYNYNYSSSEVKKGESYKSILDTPRVDADVRILAIDPGFVDTCVIQLFVQGKDHVWRLPVRWQLSRIDFKLQEEIIDWLATHYDVQKIAIDIGAGGELHYCRH